MKKRKYCKKKIIFATILSLFCIYLLFYIFFNNTYADGYNISKSGEGVVLKKSEEISESDIMVNI